MDLIDRKYRILQAIIDDYILTALPVGSRTISRKYEQKLSSATIRNEMSDLEELGYLDSPHTSAGRVPSYKAYRLYVDQMLTPEALTAEEKEAFLAAQANVALGSDAFFPFSDNIKRAAKSGVKYIAEPGGSIRDDAVIDECNRRGMVMAFTGMRLFHH